MSNVCQCCGSEKQGGRCTYCGYVEVIDLDSSGAEFVQGLVSGHKERIISTITDISLVTYLYRWNDGKSRLEQEKKETLKLADGCQCYPGLKWSEYSFGQLSNGQALPLELSYKVRGVKKTLRCSVSAVQCEDFWKVGLLIDPQLRLTVFVGTETTFAHTEPLALELL